MLHLPRIKKKKKLTDKKWSKYKPVQALNELINILKKKYQYISIYIDIFGYNKVDIIDIEISKTLMQ